MDMQTKYPNKRIFTKFDAAVKQSEQYKYLKNE